MKRTFKLAEKLPVTFIPYIMQMVHPSPNTYLFFNGARVHNQDSSITGDPFNVSAYLNDPNLTTPEEVSHQVATVIQPFRDFFRVSASGVTPEIAAGMEELFAATNKFSMRSYMFQLGMDAKAINWCETLDKSTGWYDRALTESTCFGPLRRFMVMTWAITAVIESLAFHWPTVPLPKPEPPILHPNKGWYCFEYVLTVFKRRLHLADALHFVAEDLRHSPMQCTRLSREKRFCHNSWSVLFPRTPRTTA